MLIGGAVDGLRAARFALNDYLPAAAANPADPNVLAGARHMSLLMGQALALALLVEHAAATDDEATKVAAELWGRARSPRTRPRSTPTACSRCSAPAITAPSQARVGTISGVRSQARVGRACTLR
jgi:hypothetical protein